MARTLRYIGLALLAVVAWSLLASELGWITDELADTLFRPLAGGGAACLAIGLVWGMLDPVGRAIKRDRCVRCGTPIERGQTYCRDHLRETVNEYRDQIQHGRSYRRGRDSA